MNAPVCIVDADAGFRAEAAAHLAAHGLATETYAQAHRFLAMLGSRRPGCVILDLNLPDLPGLELQHRLHTGYCCMPVIFVAEGAGTATVVQAMREGAFDFLPKPVAMADLLEAVQLALENQRHMDEGQARREAMRRRVSALTERERDVLMLALSGKSNKEISLLLGLSHRTVENHRAHIMDKLAVGNLLEIAHAFTDMSEFLAGSARESETPVPAHSVPAHPVPAQDR